MKSIFTALAPNFQKDDAWLATKLQFLPWLWKRGPALGQLADALKKRLQKKHIVLFETGRTGLEMILKAAGIGSGDEVLLQAFTCVAVPNSVLWAGAKPVYVDCNEQYAMDAEDLKKKISPRAKAIIVQHTFGNMADVEAIKKAVGDDMLIIEDCAHSLEDSKKGDVSFFSFGRDKVISSVFGGGVATNDDSLGKKLQDLHASLPQPSCWWISRQLKYVSNIVIARATFDWGIGWVMLALMRLIPNKPVTMAEKRGAKPGFVGKQFPNALAILALHQLGKLDTMSMHRKKIAAIYTAAFPEGSGLLRFTLHAKMPKIRGMFLGDWYTTAIAPGGVSYQVIGYDPSTCPTAERITKDIINLPTDIHITEHDAYRIRDFVKGNLE